MRISDWSSDVCSSDLSMLDVVAAEAARRGLDNLATCHGKAEHLPFADGEFDLVLCCYSTHHWQDPGQALREARRVLKPGGIAAFADVVSPGEPLLDTWLQMLEVLRDNSHVRNYAVAEWLRLLAEAGFVLRSCTPRRITLEFASWVDRMRTPAPLVAALRHLLAHAPEPVHRHYAIAPDRSEEHTSELQSLMRISYAVFCLIKKHMLLH